MENLEGYSKKLFELALDYGPKLVGAIVVLILGLWVIKIINKMVVRAMERSEMDESLQPFLKSLTSTLLKVLLVISVLGMLGVAMTSFIAILGAAGLAVGMALSGTLQNFAGGVMILIFKPFHVGDFIEAQGHSGTVNKILIFNTILKTPDNKTIIIPNGGLSTDSLVNYSTEPQRRVDWAFGIGYGDDYEQAKAVLLELIAKDKRILQDPEPFIELASLDDSAVTIAVRVWVNAEDYWGVHFSMNQAVYKVFDEKNLNIPYPQMDVHLIKD